MQAQNLQRVAPKTGSLKNMFAFKKSALALVAAAGATALLAAAPAQAQTIKAVMHSDVKILDPIWTTAYIQRNHGYMIWDTLFAVDEKFAVKPQMVDKYEVSPDKLVWTFTLRDGLEWHDGKPVTSEDCIASIKRWAVRDSMGQKMMGSVEGMEAVDAKTFKMKLKEPYGLVLESLGKPSSNVPFMMPKKTAETDPMQQIKLEDVIGSGPFIFKGDEWKPGEKIVYVKNAKYKPRAEPASASPAARWSRSTGSSGSDAGRADPGRCSAERRDRHDRIARPRPAAAARQGQEHQAGQLQSDWATSTPSASTARPSPSTIPRSATPCSSPSPRRISSRPRSAIRNGTRSARRRSYAAVRSRPTPAWPRC